MKYSMILIICLLAPEAYAADSCDNAVSDPEINECASKDFDRADAALNHSYKKVLADLDALGKDMSEAVQAKHELIAAQRQWVAFREADCNAVFTLNKGGTVRTLMYLSCMSSHAAQRTKELDTFIQ